MTSKTTMCGLEDELHDQNHHRQPEAPEPTCSGCTRPGRTITLTYTIVNMCCITKVVCHKCKKVGRARIELCDNNTGTTMCIKSDTHITNHLTQTRSNTLSLHVYSFMGVAQYPGECFPSCPSTEIVMKKELIVLKNNVELTEEEVTTTLRKIRTMVAEIATDTDSAMTT